MRRVGHVYFIRCGDYVKIGFSTDHQSRIRAISANTPYEVALEALHEGTRADEAAFHKILAPYRHKCEWFVWCDAVKHLATTGLTEWAEIQQPTPLDAARKRFGGDRGLAKALGNISSQAISQWKRVPVMRVLQVEKVSGVSRHDLRPDIYPAPKTLALS